MFLFCFLCVALKQELTRKHKDALQTCKSHNLALLKTNQQAELEVSILSPSHLLPDTFVIDKSCVFSFSGSRSPHKRGAKNDGQEDCGRNGSESR